MFGAWVVLSDSADGHACAETGRVRGEYFSIKAEGNGEEVGLMEVVVIASCREVVEDRGPFTAFPFGFLFHFYCFIIICIRI